MVKCPNCNQEFDIPIAIKEDKSCPNCGRSLLSELPGYPKRSGYGTRNTLSIAWCILRRNFTKIVIFLTVPTLILAVLNVFTFWEIIVPTYSNLAPISTSYAERPDIPSSQLIKGLLIGFGVSLSYWILQHTFMGGIVRMASDSFVGKIVKTGVGMKIVKEKFLGLFGVSILTTLLLTGSLIISLLIGTEFCCFGLIGIFVSIFLFIILLYWIQFSFPILVLEDEGIIKSILKSRALSRSRKGTLKFTFGLIFIYITFSMFFGFLVQLAWSASFFQKSIYHLSLQIGIQAFVILFQLLVLSFCFILITVHYLKISDFKKIRFIENRI